MNTDHQTLENTENAERITRWRFLFNWQEEKKIAWLQSMAAQGWLLEKVRPFFYIFRRGEPADIVYRLDYIRLYGKQWREYLALFQDAGWEYVGGVLRWRYFRKPNRPGESHEIYTDSLGQIAKYRRLVRMIAVILLIAICNLSLTFSTDNPGRHALVGPFRLIHFVYLIILLLLSYGGWRALAHIRRLRQQIRGKL